MHEGRSEVTQLLFDGLANWRRHRAAVRLGGKGVATVLRAALAHGHVLHCTIAPLLSVGVFGCMSSCTVACGAAVSASTKGGVAGFGLYHVQCSGRRLQEGRS